MPPISHPNDEHRISVTATIEGHPDSVLRQLRTARSGAARRVQIELTLPRPKALWAEPYQLPVITNGDTAAAHEFVQGLYRQGRLSGELYGRVTTLIDGFGEATR
jgi:hypothetical protein